MPEVQYTDLPDSQTQQIKKEMAKIKEYATPTLDSYEASTRKVRGGQQGFQIPFFVSDYGQNSYLAPGAAGNSFAAPVAPTSQSMYVGLAYPGKAMYTDGIFMETMDTEASLISNAQLRRMAIENYMKHMNYYAIGDNFGYGILAVVTSVTNPGTAGVFTGTTAATTVSGYTKGAHRLLKNVVYDIVDESSLTVVGTITPSQDGIFSATVPVTSTGAANNAGAFVVEQGAFFKVPRGTNYLINNVDRTFQGLDTTVYSEFNSSFVDLNGSALTSATINTLETKVQIRQNAPDAEFARICHMTPGQYNTLAIQGYASSITGYNGRQDFSNGEKGTTYGLPKRFKSGGISFALDADFDEDRVMMRRASDFFQFELRPFGSVNRDGLKLRQAPGDNNVGADAWFEQVAHYYSLGFDGGGSPGVGNGSSAFAMRAAVTNSQVNVLS